VYNQLCQKVLLWEFSWAVLLYAGTADAGTADARNVLERLDSRRMSFTIEHHNTDVDNAGTITRTASLTTTQTDSLRHVVLFI